jgi:hypothetical protein
MGFRGEDLGARCLFVKGILSIMPVKLFLELGIVYFLHGTGQTAGKKVLSAEN